MRLRPRLLRLAWVILWKDHLSELQAILSADPERSRILKLVQSLGLPDCWVGGGFLRTAVWDHLHGRPASKPSGDVDVVWFDPKQSKAVWDRAVEARLTSLDPSVAWSVKNQARMHERNGDPAYTSVVDAMRHWPETATAIAVKSAERGEHEFAGPFGFDDLFNLVIRPTPRFALEKHRTYLDRVHTKRWLQTWPLLRSHDPSGLMPTMLRP